MGEILIIKEIQILISHLIKSRENYNLTDIESIETINKILEEEISRKSYYNYKKKLYDKEIIVYFRNIFIQLIVVHFI